MSELSDAVAVIVEKAQCDPMLKIDLIVAAMKADVRIGQLEDICILAVETLDDDAPGPGTTEKDLLRQLRTALAQELAQGGE